MQFGKAAVGALAAVCVTVGAGGVYLLTRGGESGPAATETSSISLDPAAQTVEQSEAIVVDEVEAVAPAAPAAPVIERRPAPVRPAAPRPRDINRAPPRTQPVSDPVESRTSLPRTEAPAAAPEPEPARALDPEPERALEPAAPEFVDLVVAADSVIGLQVETSITSERARIEDEVTARVTRDVRVGDRVAIPAGAKAYGEVTLVERGGRLRDRARLGIRFTSLVLADGTRLPLDTDAIYREGDAPGGESAAKIGGGAIGGAIIGGILGGARGAAIGGSIGAGAGTAATLAGGRNPATLPSGTPVTVRLVKPTTVTVEK